MNSDGSWTLTKTHYTGTTCDTVDTNNPAENTQVATTDLGKCVSATGTAYYGILALSTTNPVSGYTGVALTNYYGSTNCPGPVLYSVAVLFDACFSSGSDGYMYGYVSATQMTAKMFTGSPTCSGTPTTASATLDVCKLNSAYTTCPTSGCPKSNYKLYSTDSIIPPAASSASTNAASCFASSETVELADGSIKALSDVQLGDRVLTASMDGAAKGYSPVIAVPHAGDERVRATFAQLSTASGRDLRLTTSHLLLAGSCALSSLPLVQAGSVAVGDCVQTTSGKEQVTAVSTVTGQGIASIVTLAGDLVVVNGVTASPFAVNHAIPEAWYSIHRMLYALFPALLGNKLFQQTSERFGDLSVQFSA